MKHTHVALFTLITLSTIILFFGIKIETANNTQKSSEPESTLSLGFPEETQRIETDAEKKERKKREKERKEREKREKNNITDKEKK